ncbi:pachytene checkpoint protein 2-like protein [Vairimorpha necatrix]|uniref:Pachytene checkpoint protein 2-like protein n=1 Tax=Vairimorpha necatrix TaxID=6039 RepID=A0AAX4JAG6_9MICR
MRLVVEINQDKKFDKNEDFLINFHHLQERIKNIRICELISSKKIVYSGIFNHQNNIKFKFIYFKFSKEVMQCEFFTLVSLPAFKFRNLYDQLVLDEEVKLRILKHFYKIQEYHKKKINISIFDINKTALIFGPPGTGKTTLAKAIFNRFSIRLKNKSYFIEISCNKFFSRFYGGTLNSFQKLKEELINLSKEKFILILFDEIESILISRDIILSHNEPLESMRVVNCFLIFLDELKSNPKIFIIFTSNNYGKLDTAFLDRCDIKMLIDIPKYENIVIILRNIFDDLMRNGLLINYEMKYSELKELASFFQEKSSRQITKMIFELLDIKNNTFSELLSKLRKNFNK